MSSAVYTLDKEVQPCLGCGDLIASEAKAAEHGVKVHCGKGMCQPCYRRKARETSETRARPEPELPDRRDISWREWAKCQDTDPEFFFPIATDMRNPAWRKATAFCRGCPVISECLEDALDTKSLYGVRGGLDRNQLEKLFRLRNKGRRAA